MNLTQAFKMAFKSILSKKMRSLLTMLGIIIGIAAVMIIVSVINGANQKQMEYYESMGTNKITVYADLYNVTMLSTKWYYHTARVWILGWVLRQTAMWMLW